MESDSVETSDEWEEEVIVLVELKGLPSTQESLTCRDTCAILGIDTAEPMLQLDQYLFKGSYENILGTTMVFEQNREDKKLNYICKTNKKLSMNRVILKPNEATMKSTDEPNEATMKSTDERNEATMKSTDEPNEATMKSTDELNEATMKSTDELNEATMKSTSAVDEMST